MKAQKTETNKPTSFIRKTYKMLSKPKNSGVVSWCADGESFIIKNQHEFTNVILPQYFKHKNFASFNRQLNMYGFHKTREDALEFNHPLFRKNSECLLPDIHRKITEPQMIKETTSDLGLRLKKFQSQQDTMEEMLENLEKQYDMIVEQNQVLICELMQSKQREKNIEMFIQKIKEKIDLEKESESFEESQSDKEDYLKLSPLSEE
jgi:heat shock transcription factor 1